MLQSERAPDAQSYPDAGSGRAPADSWLEPLRLLTDREQMRFIPPLRRGARALEIGAGEGRLVRELRARGIEATGIDPFPHPRRSQDLVPVALEDFSAPDGSFHLVVFWHSLEHFDDPGEALQRVRPWMAEDGRLVVAVPNAASLQARLGDGRWFHEDVPRHAVQFSPTGLHALLRRCGFVPLRTSTFSLHQNLLGMWQTLLNRLTSERDVAFRLLKGRLPARKSRRLLQDIAVTTIAGPPLVPVAIVAEACAALARRGGSIVVQASVT